jgi:hypothetical protein
MALPCNPTSGNRPQGVPASCRRKKRPKGGNIAERLVKINQFPAVSLLDASIISRYLLQFYKDILAAAKLLLGIEQFDLYDATLTGPIGGQTAR